MKLKVVIGLFILSFAFSCKGKEEEQVKQENPTEANANVTSIQLANYSDENWKNGVGLSTNMLLVDFSKEKMDLISKGTELLLPNGEKVKYIGFEKADNYIHIQLGDKKPTVYQSAIEYPNEITIK
jgi:hypothetical protein